MADVKTHDPVIPPERVEMLDAWLKDHADDIAIVADTLAGAAEKRVQTIKDQEIEIDEMENNLIGGLVPPETILSDSDTPVKRSAIREQIFRVFENIVHQDTVRVNFLWPVLELLSFARGIHSSIDKLYQSLKSQTETVLDGTIYEKEYVLGKTKKELEKRGLLKLHTEYFRDVPPDAIVTGTTGKGVLAFIPHSADSYSKLMDFSFVFDRKIPKKDIILDMMKDRKLKIFDELLHTKQMKKMT